MEIENILKLLSPVGVIAGVAKIIYERLCCINKFHPHTC